MASSILKSSKEIPNCYPCYEIDDFTIDAVYLCENCNHTLCKPCREHHRKTLITRDHKVTNLFDIRSRESMIEISGRREKGRSPQKEETGDDQYQDLEEHLPDVPLSADISTKPGTSKAVHVYKTATFQSGLNVSIDSDDSPCVLVGIVMLQDNIIVSDQANYKLKVFDSDHTFLYEHVFDDKPCDIDVLEDITIVISVWDETIRLLSVGRDSMVELLQIKTDILCIGVCCLDGNIYAVANEDCSDTEMLSVVYVYTQNGKFKRRFEFLSDGKVECNQLMFIAANSHTGTLYVTDMDKGVVALSTSGHVIAVVATPLLESLRGIAVDDFGHIYVCGVNSNNVLRMSADGHDAVEIISENSRCKYPQCIKIYGNKMFLVCRRRNTVSIYELS